jgi:hypothetical protein
VLEHQLASLAILLNQALRTPKSAAVFMEASSGDSKNQAKRSSKGRIIWGRKKEQRGDLEQDSLLLLPPRWSC